MDFTTVMLLFALGFLTGVETGRFFWGLVYK